MRTLIGLGLGILLFLVGIPVMQSVMKSIGYAASFSYQDAVLGMLLVLGCVIAVQLTALRPPKDKD